MGRPGMRRPAHPADPVGGDAARSRPLAESGDGQPQHFFSASSEVIDSTPLTGLSVTSVTPVLKKSRPGEVLGFSPLFLKATIASTPIEAMSSGYCIEVAPMTPALTFLTPGQPPSTSPATRAS